MVAAGMWSQLDSFQCYAMDSSVNALTDWIAVDGSSDPIIAVNSNATFTTTNRGFLFDYTAQGGGYIETTTVMNAGANIDADDGMMFIRGENMNVTGSGTHVMVGSEADNNHDFYISGDTASPSHYIVRTMGTGGPTSTQERADSDHQVIAVAYDLADSPNDAKVYVGGVATTTSNASSNIPERSAHVNGYKRNTDTHTSGKADWYCQMWGFGNESNINHATLNSLADDLMQILQPRPLAFTVGSDPWDYLDNQIVYGIGNQDNDVIFVQDQSEIGSIEYTSYAGSDNPSTAVAATAHNVQDFDAPSANYDMTEGGCAADYIWQISTGETIILVRGIADKTSGDGSPATITGITQANPAVVTATGHGLSDNDNILISNVNGMTEVSGGTYRMNYLDANSFELIGVNSTGYGAFTSSPSAEAEKLTLDDLSALYRYGGLWSTTSSDWDFVRWINNTHNGRRALTRDNFVEFLIDGVQHLIFCEYDAAGDPDYGQLQAHISADAGATWTTHWRANADGSNDWRHFHSVHIDPRDGRIVYAVGDRSSDGGADQFAGLVKGPRTADWTEHNDKNRIQMDAIEGFDCAYGTGGTGQKTRLIEMEFDSDYAYAIPDTGADYSVAGIYRYSTDFKTQVRLGVINNDGAVDLDARFTAREVVGGMAIKYNGQFILSDHIDVGADTSNDKFYFYSSIDGINWYAVAKVEMVDPDSSPEGDGSNHRRPWAAYETFVLNNGILMLGGSFASGLSTRGGGAIKRAPFITLDSGVFKDAILELNPFV